MATVMSKWKEYNLSSFMDFNPPTPLKKDMEHIKIGMEHLASNGKKIRNWEIANYNGGAKFKNGDTLVARITPCLENGKIGYVDMLKDGEVAFGSTEFIVLREKQDISDSQFIFYFAYWNEFRDLAIQLMTGSSGRQRVETDALKNKVFEFPPLPEQKAIAEVLSSLDDKIDLLHRQNKTLEAMAEALFRQWFVENPNKNWREGKLGDYVIIKRGGSPRPIQNYLSETGYKWLKISDVTSLNSPFIFEIKECIKEEGLNKTVHLKSGALVLSNSATPGIPKILMLDTCIHDGWLYFQNSYFSNEFLYLFFKYIHPQLVSQGNGSIFINLKTDIVKCFPLYIPKKDQLLDFQETIYPLFNKLLSNSAQINTLENLRNALLPKLMSGEVRLKVL
jgi:type I restriction enzyme S subunit